MQLYSNGNIEEKRHIIGSIFPEKWTIIEIKAKPAIELSGYAYL